MTEVELKGTPPSYNETEDKPTSPISPITKKPWWAARDVVPPPKLYIPPPNGGKSLYVETSRNNSVPRQTFTSPLQSSRESTYIELGPYPRAIKCPHCHEEVTTYIRPQKHFCCYRTLFLCCGMCMLFCCPSKVKQISQVKHVCPLCNSMIGVFNC